MIRIAICDDEQKDREKLQRFIQEFIDNSLQEFILGEFASGEQLLGSGFAPDILFLDIMMGGKDGIQVGNEMKRHSPDTLIIYITNLREKISVAVNRVHAFGYLKKPIARVHVFGLLADALDYVKEDLRAARVVFLSDDRAVIELLATDIYYFEYSQRKVRIVAKDRNYVCREKISEVAKKMEPYGFAMCHQSFVVNLYEVEKIVPQKLIMRNGDSVYLAQKRQSTIRKMIMRMVSESAWKGESKGNLT